MTGYSFQVDHVEYVAHEDGRPLTLVDCLAAVRGCGNASVWGPTGRPACRLTPRYAGSLYERAHPGANA